MEASVVQNDIRWLATREASDTVPVRAHTRLGQYELASSIGRVLEDNINGAPLAQPAVLGPSREVETLRR